MCIQETTVCYWQLDSRCSQYLYPDIYDTHVLYYAKYESCSSRPSPAFEWRTATGTISNIQQNASYTSWDVSILYLIIITLFADQHINLKHVERILDKTTQFHWMFCCIFFLSLPAQSFVHIGLNSSEEMSVMLSEQKAVAKYDIPWGTFTLQGVKMKINYNYSFVHVIINNINLLLLIY